MTRAVTLAEIADTNTFVVDGANSRVGINSSSPTTTLDVGGAVKATSFTGDGSGLTGVASTDNIVTGTAATFTGGVNISGITTVGVLTAYTSVTVGTAITADAASGIVTATKFVGDGSALTGVSGFATALSSDQTSPLNVFFKTPQQVNIGAGTSVTVESDATSGNIAFIRENIIHVATGATFHVKTNTTLVPNVLGLF